MCVHILLAIVNMAVNLVLYTCLTAVYVFPPAIISYYLVHVVLSVDSTLRRQTHVGVIGCSHLERDRGPAAQRHAGVDV